jgi:ATP-dependent DNA helicase RecQ
LLEQETTEELAENQKAGIKAKAYHAGFDNTIRQNARYFINDDCQVVCATIALGKLMESTNRMYAKYPLQAKKKTLKDTTRKLSLVVTDYRPKPYCFESYGDVIQLQKLPHRGLPKCNWRSSKEWRVCRCLELPQENFLLSYFNWSPKKLRKLRHL